MTYGDPKFPSNPPVEFLCIAVTNKSDRQGSGGAEIIELVSDNGRSIPGGIELLWPHPGYGDQGNTAIPALGTRIVKVFRNDDGQVNFNMGVVPYEFRSIFDGATKLIGKIAFDDYSYASEVISFILHLDAPPRLELVHTEARNLPRHLDVEQEDI
jgi:hypothetical protein